MFDDVTNYQILKWVHILSAFLLFGTGLGSAFYKWMSDRSGNIHAQAVTAKHVVLADWIFTTPTVFIQPATGYLLLLELGIPITEPWVMMSFGLFILAGICWLPVVWLQIEMKNMAELAVQNNTALPEKYNLFARIWFALGWPAFIAIMIAVWLMVTKPDFGIWF